MSAVPRAGSLDDTLALLREGYEYIPRRCQRHSTEIFTTRLGLLPVICMRGPEAARIFYDPARFRRSGAIPGRVTKTLFGRHGVQTLDGAAHRHRKQMLLSVVSDESVADLTRVLRRQWYDDLARWETMSRVVLFEEAGRILCRTVFAWAGVPLADSDVDRRTQTLHALIDAPAAVGPRHWRGRIARRRADRWAAHLVDDVRAGTIAPPAGSALHSVAWHRNLDGRLLDAPVAAVELLNVLRPTVAVDRFVVFAALALHRHPEWREYLATGDEANLDQFVQEVRRWSPFFPFVGAKVRSAFDWNGVHFPAGRLVLLDLYGTNHDPRVWQDPGAFDPTRFSPGADGVDAADPDAYTLVPQGGGDATEHHRCPGEPITVAVMKTAVRMLTQSVTYDVPQQNLSINPARIPALPASGFVLTDVRPTMARDVS